MEVNLKGNAMKKIATILLVLFSLSQVAFAQQNQAPQGGQQQGDKVAQGGEPTPPPAPAPGPEAAGGLGGGAAAALGLAVAAGLAAAGGGGGGGGGGIIIPTPSHH